ncbi:MAG: hypothetical protein HY645_14830 [Acidobacteria bacterium]|nr:hypothetical protein [Acidobacteriota bacterium]
MGNNPININFRRRGGKRFRVLRPDRSGVEQVVQTRETWDGGAKQEIIDVTTCPCGTVLHHLDEVAAFCAVPGCPEALCADCAKENVCSICGRIFCIGDKRETMSGKKTCSMHWLVSRLFL